MFLAEIKEGKAVISGLEIFDLERSCRCGQAFRWQRYKRGFFGVARGCGVYAEQDGDVLTLEPCGEDRLAMWIDYFDLKRDYSAVVGMFESDERLRICLPESCGIRVFNQEPFETLISFIVSANNNIKRISGSLEAMSRLCGKRNRYDDRVFYSFPDPESIASLSIEQLLDCGTGYRAPYIKETAKAVCDGFSLEALRDTDIADARRKLLSLKGVGPKVADCVLLFSLGFSDAFPMDVWMNRAVRHLFFNGEIPSADSVNDVVKKLGPLAGIAQQYIFYFARENKFGKD